MVVEVLQPCRMQSLQRGHSSDRRGARSAESRLLRSPSTLARAATTLDRDAFYS